jgi:NADP-dependent 3-hydroxy acid dehydrogenase YdfG
MPARQAALFLVGRRLRGARANAADLNVRGAEAVGCALLDANDHDRHEAVLAEAWAAYGGFDVALVAHGVLPDQAASERSVAATLASFDTNAASVIALLTLLATASRRRAAACWR